MQQLKKENLALQQERDWILQAEGLEPDDLTVQPICPTCGGTGYVGAAMCECLKELCRQEQKKELTNLFGAESFEKFRLDLYSDQYDATIPQQPARSSCVATYRMAQNYAQSFPADGTSHWSSPARPGWERRSCPPAWRASSRSGVFPSATRRWGSCLPPLRRTKFRPQPDAARTEDVFACDLLIIDDLGTEMTTQFTVSVALSAAQHPPDGEQSPSFVSTNLTPWASWSSRYSAADRLAHPRQPTASASSAATTSASKSNKRREPAEGSLFPDAECKNSAYFRLPACMAGETGV